MTAAAVNNVQVIQQYCQTLSCLQTESGITALMIAAAQGFDEIVQILLPYEKNIKDYSDRTAYDHALLNGHYSTSLILEEQYKEQHLLEAFKAYDKAVELKLQKLQKQCLQIIQHVIQKRVPSVTTPLSDNKQQQQKPQIHYMTSLMYAAKHNLYQFISQLMDYAGLQDENGRTASMYAAQNNNYKVFQLLFDKESKLQDNNGKTASVYAAVADAYECLSISYTDEYNIRDKYQNTLLHFAAANNSLRILNEIKDAYIQNVNQRGETAYMYAAKWNSIGALEILKEEEDLVDLKRDTALMFAAENDSCEAVEKLIDRQQNQRNSDGLKAIDFALQRQVSKSLPYLLQESKNQQNILFKLIDQNKLQTLKIVCDVARQGSSQLSSSVYNYKQQQLCHIAIQQKFVATTKEEKMYQGVDLLTYAVLTNKSDFVTILSFVIKNAQFNGYTPLMIAVQKDNLLDQKAIRALITNFAGRVNQEGQTALIIGIQSQVDNDQILKQLIDIEAHMTDKYGKRAADYALLLKKDKFIQLLRVRQ